MVECWIRSPLFDPLGRKVFVGGGTGLLARGSVSAHGRGVWEEVSEVMEGFLHFDVVLG